MDVGQQCIVGAQYLELTLTLEASAETALNSVQSVKRTRDERVRAAAGALNVSRTSTNKAAALSETIRLMAEIDAVIDKHGGWPLK